MNRLTIFFIFFSSICYAQNGKYALGARTLALAGSGVNLDGPYTLFNNVGSIGIIKETSFFVSHQNRYGLPELNARGGGVILHHPSANLGLKYFRFGGDLYNEQLFGLALGNQLQKISLGLGLDLIQTKTEGVKTHHRLVIEFGGRVELTPKLILCASLFNPASDQEHPTNMKIGLGMYLTKNILITTELEKQLLSPQRLKTGMEYALIPKLLVRTGIRLQSSALTPEPTTQVKTSFGIGLILKKLSIDYGFTNQNPLGTIHELSISYQKTKN